MFLLPFLSPLLSIVKLGFKILLFGYQTTNQVNIMMRIIIFLGNENTTIINEENVDDQMIQSFDLKSRHYRGSF